MCAFVRLSLLRCRQIVSCSTGVTLLITASLAEPTSSTPTSSLVSEPATRGYSSALKPIDPAALQATLASAAKELLVSGAATESFFIKFSLAS